MKHFFYFIAISLLVTACSVEDAKQARLMDGAKPALRYNSHKTEKKLNTTDEKIRLLKAQTTAKAHLANIEMKQTEKLRQLEAESAASLAKLEAEKATTLAKLEAEKAKKIKELELQQAQSTNSANTKMAAAKAQAEVAIEKERQANLIIKQKEDLAFYRQLTIVVVVLVLLLMLLLYLLYRHRQKLKLKLHEEELKHQTYLLESQNHHERVTKLLDIIANDSTDKGLKKELTKLLKDQGEKPPILLEGK